MSRERQILPRLPTWSPANVKYTHTEYCFIIIQFLSFICFISAGMKNVDLKYQAFYLKSIKKKNIAGETK